MHTLIINGSYRENGDTVYIINELKKNINGTITLVNTYKENISPCLDCRVCHNKNKCSINDNMYIYNKEIEKSDNIIIASPLYYSMLTGTILNFASRFQYYFASKYIRKDFSVKLKNKKGYLIIVGGGATKDTSAVIKTTKLILRQINTSLDDILEYINTDNISAEKSEYLKDKIIDFAEIINRR